MGSSNAKIGPARVTNIEQIAAPLVGAVAAFASRQGHSHVIKALCPAGQIVYVGRTADIASVSATVKTYPLFNAEFLVVENKDLNDYCFFASAAGASVAIIDTSFY